MALQLWITSGVESSRAGLWLAWLFTYFVHAILWTAATTLIVRQTALSSATQHLLWKMAMFGPLVTALLAAAVPWSVERAFGAGSYHPEIASWVLADRTAAAPLVGSTYSGALESIQEHLGWNWFAMGSVAAVLLGLLRFMTSLWSLRRKLAERSGVHDARLLQRLAHVRASTGLPAVALTQSSHVAGPLIIGTAEICLPRAKLCALPDAEIDAVFAHELAHLERGDGLWFPLVGFVQAVLWMQPTNHLVASRFRQSAELACDDRAVELTGDPLGLARALTEVAASAFSDQRRIMVPAMASAQHTLVQRVKRLANPGDAGVFGGRPRGRVGAITSLSALGFAIASLGVHVARAGVMPSATHVAAVVERATAPDSIAVNQELDELLRREQALEAQLVSALAATDAARSGTPAFVRVIELRQALSHVRATQTWTEERFVDAWTKWQARQGLASGAASATDHAR